MAVLETLTWGGTNVANTRRYWLANVAPTSTSRKNFIDIITSGAICVGQSSGMSGGPSGQTSNYYSISSNALTPATSGTNLPMVVLDVTATYIDVFIQQTSITSYTSITSKKGAHTMERICPTGSDAIGTLESYITNEKYSNTGLLPVCWQQWFKSAGSSKGNIYRITLAAS